MSLIYCLILKVHKVLKNKIISQYKSCKSTTIKLQQTGKSHGVNLVIYASLYFLILWNIVQSKVTHVRVGGRSGRAMSARRAADCRVPRGPPALRGAGDRHRPQAPGATPDTHM